MPLPQQHPLFEIVNTVKCGKLESVKCFNNEFESKLLSMIYVSRYTLAMKISDTENNKTKISLYKITKCVM